MLSFIRNRVEKIKRSHAEGRKAKDLGQNMIEYVGLVVLVAAVIAAIVGSGVFDEFEKRFTCNVQNVFGEPKGDCTKYLGT